MTDKAFWDGLLAVILIEAHRQVDEAGIYYGRKKYVRFIGPKLNIQT